jgi:hypothetical protein
VSPKLKLALIFLACASPFLLAWLAYEMQWTGGHQAGNYGELVPPRVLAGPLTPLKGKWVLVTADAAACDAACERKLYVVRQSRKAQGKEQARIERLWLLLDDATPRAELLAAIEGTRVVRDAGLARSLPGGGDGIYLVDPLGNLMMRFPADADPARVLKDLQRLLKYSRIG